MSIFSELGDNFNSHYNFINIKFNSFEILSLLFWNIEFELFKIFMFRTYVPLEQIHLLIKNSLRWKYTNYNNVFMWFVAPAFVKLLKLIYHLWKLFGQCIE